MKNLLLLSIMSLILWSCSKGFTEKHSGSFKANGVAYTADENGVTASYPFSNANTLDVSVITGSSSTYAATVRLDLTKVDQTLTIDSTSEGFSYIGTSSAVIYRPVSGTYKITSHKEGNPATRHTEGEFNFVVVNPYNLSDTVRITEGKFYVNNY
jgi:hypothetical protein